MIAEGHERYGPSLQLGLVIYVEVHKRHWM